MIPSALVVLDRLPRDANGKLDRRALGAPVVSVTSRQLHARPAGDALERELIAIWEQHLKRRGLGATDDFFELGGDSLLAAQTVLAIERATHVRLSPNALYVAPTVAQLAAHLRSQAGAAPSPGGEGGRGQPGDGAADSILVPMQPLGSRPPLFFVHDHGGSLVGYADLVRRLGLDQPCYGLRSPWEQSPGTAPATLEEMATRYRVAIQALQPAGPYQRCGTCFGGVLAFEVARQLIARGEPVALLAIIAVTPFDFPGLVSANAGRLFALHGARARCIPRMRYYAARLGGLTWKEALRYLRGRSKRVIPLLRNRWRALVRPHARPGARLVAAGRRGGRCWPHRGRRRRHVVRAACRSIGHAPATGPDATAARAMELAAAVEERGLNSAKFQVF